MQRNRNSDDSNKLYNHSWNCNEEQRDRRLAGRIWRAERKMLHKMALWVPPNRKTPLEETADKNKQTNKNDQTTMA